MGLMKKALWLKVGQTAYNEYNRRRGTASTGRPVGRTTHARGASRGTGGDLARLAQQFLRGRR
ncbi:hypothetical protein [Egicoccus sp. AB-alg2]|uniref:hypothetical protein n=1 Tax=Egicoccus sp. AB-alg2 TaxID=3242693 RepID=UPI00359D13AE